MLSWLNVFECFGDFVYIIYIYEVDKMTFVVLC